MNNETSNKKDSILKILAITGFIGIIILIAWASIQLVSVAPSAFSSLASLAESVNNPEDTEETEIEITPLTVTSNTLLFDSGDTVDVSWDTVQSNGSYVFSYECADGVAIDLINENGVRSIQCESNYNIGNVDTVSLVVDSEKNRYTDIAYSISFLGTNDIRPRAAGSAAFTVLNDTISTEIAIADEDEEEEAEPETDTSVVETPEPQTPPATTSNTPPTSSTPTTPPTSEYVQEYAYTIPTSDPNGTTDLAARYLFVGEITNNRFVPGAIEQGENGAIQFEVKNIGTKTSQRWSFTVDLPGGGTYESETQTALKPNERAVLTIGFSGADVNTHTFAVEVETNSDRNQNNDSFSQRITFID
jgi:hypothetical protein